MACPCNLTAKGALPWVISARKGFGTTLIERELKQIGGNAKLGYKDSGLEATLSIPFDPKLMSMRPGAKPS